MKTSPESDPSSRVQPSHELITLGKSPEGLPAFEITNPSPQMRSIIGRVITANHMEDPNYIARKKVGAFLQIDTDEYVLVEFWQGSPEEHQTFIDHINSLIAEDVGSEAQAEAA